jgi:hypothetical protein
MESSGFMNADYASSGKVEQLMLQVNNDIAHLVELAKDPKKYGELIGILDPTIDKVDLHVMALQNKLTEELDRRTKEFANAVKALDDPLTLAKSIPPSFLSDADIAKWHKLAESGGGAQQLAGFKKALINDFKEGMSKHLQIGKLTEQNITIRRILDKIRQTLMI